MEGLVSIQATDKPAGNRRRRKREIRPEIDRRAEHPFNGDTATRLVTDPYSTTGGKIAVTASLRDDPLGKLYARRQIDDAQYRVGLMLTEFSSWQKSARCKRSTQPKSRSTAAAPMSSRSVTVNAGPSDS